MRRRTMTWIVATEGFLVLILSGWLAFAVTRHTTCECSSDEGLADRIVETGIVPWHFDANDPLLAERKILISAEINERTSREVIYRLLHLEAVAKKPIHLYLLTTGGWTDEAFAIIDTMRSLASPVNTYALGGCSSAGAMVLAAATGTRFAFADSIIMVHSNNDPSEERYSLAKLDRDRIEQFWRMSARLPEEWFPLVGDQEYYLSPQEAKKMGIIDEIIQGRPHTETRENPQG